MIEIEFSYNLAYLLRASLAMLRRRSRWLIPAYWLTLAVAILALVFFCVFIGYNEGTEVTIPVISYFVIILILIPVLRYIRIVLFYRKSPNREALIKISISDTHIESRLKNSDSRLAWGDLYQLLENQDGFLIYHSSQIATLLPIEVFASEADKEKLRGFARAAGKFKS